MPKTSPQTSGLRVTPARRRGLEVLACSNNHLARVADLAIGCVTKPIARWMVVNGLATWYGQGNLLLTQRGADLCREEGLL